MVARSVVENEPRETELKLLFSPGLRARIEAHPALQPPGASPPDERDETSVYFDTADHRLSARGLSLRVRQSNGEREQTVKAEGSPGAAARRREWTSPVAGDEPDLARLVELGAELPGDLEGELLPIFSTEIHRTRRRIKLDRALVEADIDLGLVVAGDRSEDVAELELELLEGDEAPLYRLALWLHADLPLRLGTESKALRGRRLSLGSAAGAAEAPDLALDGSLPAAGALRRIIEAGLGQLGSNLSAAGAGDTEGVHQARVALRRLRAAFVLFGPRLEPHATSRFNDEIRRLGQVFGEARDWDVLAVETLPAAEESALVAAWVPLVREHAEAARRAAHEALEAELARPALTGLVLALGAWVQDGAAHPEILGSALDVPIGSIAPALLDRLADKLDARGRHLARCSPEELHAVRKTLKKVRYAADALASLYRRKAVKSYLKGCKALQRALGALNDAAVTVALLERLASDHGADLTPALGALARWSEERRREAHQELAGAWRELQDARRFWR
jgi:inorganic triphosphatase YgiF